MTRSETTEFKPAVLIMKRIQPRAERASPKIVTVHLLLMAALLAAGCGREKTPSANNDLEPATSQTTLPTVSPSEYDTSPSAPPVEPASTGLVATLQSTPVPPPPTPVVTTNVTQNVKPAEYAVMRGDTLFKIARAHRVKFTALSNANPNIDLAKLKVGQKIKIPPPVALPSAGIGFREPGRNLDGTPAVGRNIHVVKAGDNLTQLARQHRTTVKAIQAANGLKTTRILVGQKLRLPAGAQPGTSAEPAKPATAAMTSTPDPVLVTR